MERRIRAALTQTPEDESELLKAVDAYVDSRKSQGWSVERIIIALKDVAATTAVPRPSSRAESAMEQRREALTHITTRIIERYYGTAPTANQPADP